MTKAEIKRPAVWVGFTAFGALLVSSFLGISITPYLAIVFLLAGIVLLITRYYQKNPAALLLIFTAALFFGYYSACYLCTVSPYEQYAGEKYTVRAEILSEPEKSSGNFYYKARITHLEELNLETNFTIRLSHGEALNAKIGDTVSCTAKFYAFDDKLGLSSKTSWLADGAVLGGYIADYENVTVTTAHTRSLSYYLAELRSYMQAQIQSTLPRNEAAVLSAMLLGLRDEIPDDLESDYKGAGATHILVISGMHMAIVAQFALQLLQRLGIRRRIAAGITIPLILAFMAVSGFSSSVLRSGIMQIIFLFGLMLGRKPDALNSLGIAAALLLLFKSFWIGDISFLLSFTSTIGIITLNPRLMRLCTRRFQTPKAQRIAIRLLGPAISSVSAVAGSLPVQLYVFGTINPASILTSLLVLDASAWIIRLGLPTVLLLSIPALSSLSVPFVFVTGILIRFQNFITAFISGHLPGTAYISGKYLQGTIIVIVLFLLTAFWIGGGKKLRLSAFGLAVTLLLLGTITDTLLTYNQTKLLVFHNNYAECTALLRGDRAVILSCSGSGTKIGNFLLENGTREIELLLVGESESTIRCAEDLNENFRIERVLLPDTVYFPTDSSSETYHYGTSVALEDDLSFNVSAKGDYISFTLNGNYFVLNYDNACYAQQTCDILITDSVSDKLHGSLTFLCTEDDLYTAAPELQTGQYILSSEHEAVCLNFRPDGSYTIQNG